MHPILPFAQVVLLAAAPVAVKQALHAGLHVDLEGAWLHASGGRSGAQDPEQGPPEPESEWHVERTLVDGAGAALSRSDLAAARDQAGRAIASLLEAPAAARGGGWVETIWSAAYVATDARDAGSAQRAWEALLEVLSRALPDDHPDIQILRGNLALALRAQGDLHGARVLQELVLAVRERTLPPDRREVLISRMNLGTTLFDLLDLAGARLLYERSLENLEGTVPEEDGDLLWVRGSLAATLRAQGELERARSLEEQVLVAYARTLPGEHPRLQTARVNLALTLSNLGDLSGARVHLEQVLAVRSRTLPEDHPSLQSVRANLASILAKIGDLPRARALQEEVLSASARTLPGDHPDLHLARSNLASTIGRLGDREGARRLQEQVLEARARTLPEDHPELQVARGNLALTIKSLGDLDAAQALEEQVLAIRARTLSEEHPSLGTARLNLGDTHFRRGDLAAARELFQQVLTVKERTLPDSHPDLQTARQWLAWTLAAETAWERSQGGGPEDPLAGERNVAVLRLTLAAVEGRLAAFGLALSTAPPREVEEVAIAGLVTLDQALTFAAGYGALPPLRGLEAAAFELSETTRGVGIRAAAWRRRVADSVAYGGLRARLQAATDEWTRQLRSGGGLDAYHAARERREAAERELAAFARGSSGGEDPYRRVTVEAVASALGPEDAALAYRRFRRRGVQLGADGAASAGSPVSAHGAAEWLCAFIVRPATEGAPSSLQLVDLGPLVDLERDIAAWRSALTARGERGLAVADLGGERAGAAAAAAQATGSALRRRLLDPLEHALGGARRIVVTLDDVVNLVPLDALPGKEWTSVGDRVRIEVRSSLDELLEPNGIRAWQGIALTLGDARFDARPIEYDPESKVPDAETDPQELRVAGLLRGSPHEAGFTLLPHTGPEARGVAELWQGVAGGGSDSIVLAGAAASRSALIQLAPRARWLHVATHGWHAPDSILSMEDRIDGGRGGAATWRASAQDVVEGMSPMALCGLALAGANLPEDELGRAPGLLSGEEVAALDLAGCELAVLSACDTNVGIRRAGQGVASFQKALHMAGARSVITSLWRVPDEATAELMLDFYRRLWLEQKPKHQALWEAKLRLRDARDERGEPLYTSRDWAAWVLTGDPD